MPGTERSRSSLWLLIHFPSKLLLRNEMIIRLGTVLTELTHQPSILISPSTRGLHSCIVSILFVSRSQTLGADPQRSFSAYFPCSLNELAFLPTHPCNLPAAILLNARQFPTVHGAEPGAIHYLAFEACSWPLSDLEKGTPWGHSETRRLCGKKK